MSTASTFKVRFAISSDDRLTALILAYDRIRECKTTDTWPEKKEAWVPYFDSKALGHFRWPTPAEFKDWEKRCFSTPVPKRFTDPSLRHPWDFMSLFDAFKNGDYDLYPIERVSADGAALPFDPHGQPNGGTECMRALVKAFDHRVTEDPK